MRTLILALGLVTAVTGTVQAATLAPTKPSQLVHLLASPNITGTICGGDPAFGMRVMTDGLLAPFSIPPGQVFVMTGIEWESYAGTAGTTAQVEIYIESPGYCSREYASSAAINDPNGTASASLTFPSGIVVKSGTVPFVLMSNGTLYWAKVSGFLTKDY
jgi:hypothetical protein